ncbi:HS12B-like protein, partial [Mya arenaria]
APLLVAGIDFGTTYSGWSYSFKNEFDLDPTKVATKSWYGDQLVSLKAPTCVLIEPDGDTFSAFGYDAEAKYISLVEEEEHDKWFFFRKFKMKLYNTDIKRDMDIEDETGKKLNAKLESIDEFKRSNMEDYLYMIRDFEVKKRNVDPTKSDKPVVFRISAMLPKLVKKIKGKKIPEVIMDSLFGSTLNVDIGGSGLGRKVKVRMIYGGTEIEVDATEVATGNVKRMKIDFLS